MTSNVQEIDPVDPQTRIDVVSTILETMDELERIVPELDLADERRECEQLMESAKEIRDRKALANQQNEGSNG